MTMVELLGLLSPPLSLLVVIVCFGMLSVLYSQSNILTIKKEHLEISLPFLKNKIVDSQSIVEIKHLSKFRKIVITEKGKNSTTIDLCAFDEQNRFLCLDAIKNFTLNNRAKWNVSGSWF